MKFTKYEKVAGLFVLTACVASLMTFSVVAVKKGWFSSKVSYHTHLSSAEGVSPGTPVQMSGLRVGQVTEIKLLAQDEVDVNFEVFSSYAEKIGEGTEVMAFRPFMIGDKVIDLQMQSLSEKPLPPGSLLPSVATADLMDVLSGKKMGMFLGSFESLAKSLKVIGDAFADGQRAEEIVKVIDQLEPLVKNMNRMSVQVTKVTDVALKKKRFEEVMQNLALISREMGEMIPIVKQEAPDFAVSLARIVQNMEVLTAEFKKVTPAISAVAPELPQATLRAVEALNEAVVVLKAMQKSFLLRGSVKEVLEEEGPRKPAQEK